MPKKAFNYEKTYFYRIVCRDLDVKDCYVGHTTNFTKRKANHKKDCCKEGNRAYNYPVYQFIRANGGWDNWQMVLIEECCCKNEMEATSKERQHMEAFGATLNKNRPTITDEEKTQYYKQYMKQYMKEWRAKKKQENSSTEEEI